MYHDIVGVDVNESPFMTAFASMTLWILVAIAIAPSHPASAQSTINLEPFDPVRIGLPALTQAGSELAIKQHRDLINIGLRGIEEIRAMAPSLRKQEAIARFQETIASEVQQIARLAGVTVEDAIPRGLQIAANGQAANLPQLQSIITTILEVTRVNQLLGNDSLSSQQYQGAVQIWKTFMSAFQTKCYGQSFDRNLVFGLERQNQLLGGGFDIMPCAYRLFTAEFTGSLTSHDTWRFTHCGLGKGDWKITIDLHLQGGGAGHVEQDGSGMWSIEETRSPSVHGTQRGELRLLNRSTELADGTEIETPDKLAARITEITVFTARGPVPAQSLIPISLPLPWAERPVTMGDSPCRESDSTHP